MSIFFNSVFLTGPDYRTDLLDHGPQIFWGSLKNFEVEIKEMLSFDDSLFRKNFIIYMQNGLFRKRVSKIRLSLGPKFHVNRCPFSIPQNMFRDIIDLSVKPINKRNLN